MQTPVLVERGQKGSLGECGIPRLLTPESGACGGKVHMIMAIKVRFAPSGSDEAGKDKKRNKKSKFKGSVRAPPAYIKANEYTGWFGHVKASFSSSPQVHNTQPQRLLHNESPTRCLTPR